MNTGHSLLSGCARPFEQGRLMLGAVTRHRHRREGTTSLYGNAFRAQVISSSARRGSNGMSILSRGETR